VQRKLAAPRKERGFFFGWFCFGLKHWMNSRLVTTSWLKENPATPMDSQEILRNVIKKAGAKNIAATLGLSQSLVYKWTHGESALTDGVTNPLERIAQLFDLSQDEQLLQWLSQRAGGYFVRNPPSTCKKGFEVVPATQEIVQQFADLLGSISEAASDNTITEKEAALIRESWDELKRHTEGFVRCCEEGDFANLQEWLKKHKPAEKAA
jgi:transposase-like protein